MMKLACLFGRHRGRASAVRNQGLYFSRCEHCSCDMVRSLGRWQPVPKGFRVVWRSACAPDPIAANVPVPSPAAATAPRNEFGSLLAALAATSIAGMRALFWLLGDGLASLRRRALRRRRFVLLRLPAP